MPDGMWFTVERTAVDAQHRQIRGAAKLAGQAVGERWVKEYLPLHFRPNARERYGYRSRSPAWRSQKVRSAGRTLKSKGPISPEAGLDLVYTGRMRDMLLGLPPRVHATGGRVTVKLRAPHYIDYPKRMYGSPDMRQEITTTTEGEARQLARTFRATYLREVRKPLPKRKRRIV